MDVLMLNERTGLGEEDRSKQGGRELVAGVCEHAGLFWYCTHASMRDCGSI